MLLYQELLGPIKRLLGPDHADTLHITNNLAIGHYILRQLDQSIPLFEEMLAVLEKKHGRQHLETQRTVANLGGNYNYTGRLTEAIPLLEEAHRALRNEPDDHGVRANLLDCYAKAGRATDAARLADEMLSAARKQYAKDSPQLAQQLAYCGSAALRLQEWAKAEVLLRECLTIRAKSDPDAWQTFNTQSMLGGALLGQKKYEEARPLLLQGYEGMKQHEKTMTPHNHLRIAEAIDRLIELTTATNNPDEATKWRAERAKYPAAYPLR